MIKSILVKDQKKVFSKQVLIDGVSAFFKVTIRYDDQCGNGHNSFSITGDIHGRNIDIGGCVHEEIAEHFPELAKYIKWHLCSSDGPLHYVANTLYWLGYSGWCDGKKDSPPNFDYAKKTAIWPDMPESFVCDKDVRLLKVTRDAAALPVKAVLTERLEGMLVEFKEAVEEIGFVF